MYTDNLRSPFLNDFMPEILVGLTILFSLSLVFE